MALRRHPLFSLNNVSDLSTQYVRGIADMKRDSVTMNPLAGRCDHARKISAEGVVIAVGGSAA